MSKEENSFLPFNQDICDYKGYQYSNEALYSANLANSRYSEEILNSINFQNKNVIDIGCGDGKYSLELLKSGKAKSVTGIDLAEEAIKLANEFYGKVNLGALKFEHMSTHDVVEKGLTFDIAVMRGVIHHMSNPKEEIKRAAAIARDIIILEPNGFNPGLKILEKISSYHIQHHERSFTLNTVSEWVDYSGCLVTRAKYFGLVPMFCPKWFALFGRSLEPFIEKIPFIQKILCGQFILTARRK